MKELILIDNEEKSPKPKNIIDLLEASPTQFAEEVAKSGGVVRIFVHPEFNNYKKELGQLTYKDSTGLERINRKHRRLGKLEAVFNKLVDADTNPNIPIILFIPRSELYNVDKSETLSKLLGGNKNIYCIPTFPFDPIPQLQDMSILNNYTKEQILAYPKEAWGTVKNVFTSSGVKSIILGGIELHKVEAETSDNKKYRGCVASAYENLSDKFDITFSGLTYPDISDTRKDQVFKDNRQ